MTNNIMPSWEEWNNLAQEARDYELYKILASMDNRLYKLESKKWKRGVVHFFGSAMGAFIAVVTIAWGWLKFKLIN